MSESTGLEANGLIVRYGADVVLESVCLSARRGESVAVVGPSGSGKSTLLHCLAGVIRPDAGTVHHEGQDVTGLSERQRSDWRLRRVGLVFQFSELVPELTLEENVALPLLLAGAGRGSSRRRAGASLVDLGVGDIGGRRPGQVSGGQQQRAAIARATVHQPAVVLADEPTGALDSVTGQLVMEALLSAASTRGAALVLVTHEARLSSYCDREVTLRDGRLVSPVAL